MINNVVPEDILWRHLRDLPYFRAMVRATEDSFYQGMELPRPVLDLGCGDAHFASVAFSSPLDVGLDPWSEPLKEARTRHAYHLITQSDGGKMPFADNTFACAVSNSVLEHIPHVDLVLEETARVVRPGGLFIFCVPNQNFPEFLLGTQVFRKLGLRKTAQGYSRFFNRISRHVHCDSHDTWAERLERTGFEIEKCWDYFPPDALHIMETGHFFGLPALVARKLTGRWILSKSKANLWLPYRLVRPYLNRVLSDDGVYTFYITHRKP